MWGWTFSKWVINALPVISYSQILDTSLANSCYDESVTRGTESLDATSLNYSSQETLKSFCNRTTQETLSEVLSPFCSAASCSVPLIIAHSLQVSPICLLPLIHPFKHTVTSEWAGKRKVAWQLLFTPSNFKGFIFF